MSLMVFFVLSFSPRDVLDEIWDLNESVSESFPTYFKTLGYGTKSHRSCQGLPSMRRLKTLSVNPVVICTFFESGKDKAKKREGYPLPLFSGAHIQSDPTPTAHTDIRL